MNLSFRLAFPFTKSIFFCFQMEDQLKKLFLFLFILFTILIFQISAQTWSTPTRLTWSSLDAQEPCIITDPAGVTHVFWNYDDPTNKELLYKRSTDGGTTWSGIIQLTWNSGNSYAPTAAADPANGIHVVWRDGTPGNHEIFYKRSPDSGVTWHAPSRLTWSTGDTTDPAVAADSGTGIHVVYSDYKSGNRDIYYKRSTDSGSTWSAITRLCWSFSNSDKPSIAVDSGGGIHVVWEDYSAMNYEIYYKRSTDGGTTWSTLTRLTWNTGESQAPVICADSGSGIHVVWYDNTPGNYEIFYKRSTDYGASWSGTNRYTWNTGWSNYSVIAAGPSGGIHILWSDDTPSNIELYYRNSTDGGTSWSGLNRVTWNAGYSFDASIATDSSGGVHVVWIDSTPGPHTLFYKNRK